MEIRFATEKDVPGILTLLRQEGNIHHAIRPDLFRPNGQKYGPSQVLAMLNKGDLPIFVAVEEEAVVGFAFCKVHTYYRDNVVVDHQACEIDEMCVEETCRRQKIGTALYEAVCRYAKQRKCRSVTLNVWQANEPAMKFYESLGLKTRMLGMEAVLEDS